MNRKQITMLWLLGVVVAPFAALFTDAVWVWAYGVEYPAFPFVFREVFGMEFIIPQTPGTTLVFVFASAILIVSVVQIIRGRELLGPSPE